MRIILFTLGAMAANMLAISHLESGLAGVLSTFLMILLTMWGFEEGQSNALLECKERMKSLIEGHKWELELARKVKRKHMYN